MLVNNIAYTYLIIKPVLMQIKNMFYRIILFNFNNNSNITIYYRTYVLIALF